jgi:CheY-like chemotaxis protein/DNA-binding XRE family transcriptional regulator
VEFTSNCRIFLNRLIAQQDLKKGFGAELKRRRIETGISQERLAELADLHRTYISAVESGKRNLTLESIQRLAQALGASVASFFASLEHGPAEQEKRSDLRTFDGPGREAGTILLVEDDPKDVEFTLTAFKTAKLANPVQVASDGAAALEILGCGDSRPKTKEPSLPHLVLLDLHLPKLHGLEVLRRIRSDRRLKQMPVVVLTASRSDRDLQEAMRLGANAFLTKPVDFHRFADMTPKLRFRWALL